MMLLSRYRYGTVLLFFLLLLCLAGFLSLCWGQMDIPYLHAAASLCHGLGLPLFSEVSVPGDEEAVLWYIRIPRTAVGLLVGAGLAVSGAVLQGTFRNPLADPSIVGVSSGASVGAILAIALGLPATSMLAFPACALAGALLAVGLVVALSLRHGRIPVMTLLLSGVVVGMLLSAVAAAILTVLSEQKMQQYVFWTIGSLDYRRWEHVLLGIGPILAGSFAMLLLSRHLNVLSLGDTEARAVGMPVNAFRMVMLSLASLVTAAGVCISGNIGFVGLVVPHMLRLLVGPDHRRLLPLCLLAGGIFLVFCDSLGRVIFPAAEVRVGIMTAFVGSPYFLYLLRKQK